MLLKLLPKRDTFGWVLPSGQPSKQNFQVRTFKNWFPFSVIVPTGRSLEISHLEVRPGLVLVPGLELGPQGQAAWPGSLLHLTSFFLKCIPV